MKVKYIRWSTLNQSGARQLTDAKDYDLVLQEQISGSIAFAKRPKGAKLLKLIESGQVKDLFVEEASRLGRNALDTLNTLNLCDEKGVCVHIKNLGVSSILNSKPNPTFGLISKIYLAIAEQEKEQIKERTEMGKMVARQRGVVFGRKQGSNESNKTFLEKENNQKILRLLKTDKYSLRDIAKLTDTSAATVLKVKKVASAMKQLSS